MKKIKKLALLLLAMFTAFAFVSCSDDDDDDDDDGISVSLPESVGTNEVSGKTLYKYDDDDGYEKLVFSDSTFIIYGKEDGDTDYSKSSEAKYTYNATTKVISFAPTKLYVSEDEQEIYGTDVITSSNISSVMDKMISAIESYGITVTDTYKELMLREERCYFSSIWRMQITNETDDGVTTKDYFDGDVTKFFDTERNNGIKYDGHYLKFDNANDNSNADIEAFVTWNTSAKTFTADLYVVTLSSTKLDATKYTDVAGTYTADSDTVTLTFTSFPNISSSLKNSVSTGTSYALTLDKDTDTYTYTEPE